MKNLKHNAPTVIPDPKFDWEQLDYLRSEIKSEPPPRPPSSFTTAEYRQRYGGLTKYSATLQIRRLIAKGRLEKIRAGKQFYYIFTKKEQA